MKRKIWWQIPGTLPISKKISLQSQHGPVGKNWWTIRFVSVLEDYGENGRLSRGKHCARNGFGNNIRFGPGEVSMGILCTGSAARPVGLLFPRFSSDVWDTVIDTITNDAALTGSLITGEFSRDLVDTLEKKEIFLIPDHYRSVRAFCHCSDDQNPCIHVAAAWYFLAEVLDEDPWMLFLLHGMTREEVMNRVQTFRNLVSHPAFGSDVKEGVLDEAGIPKIGDPQGFFSCIDTGETLYQVPERNVSPILLLGPAPYRLGGKNLGERIEGLYPAMSAYAESVLFGIKQNPVNQKISENRSFEEK
ncbi:SWIM zinc finger family protein [Methanospirillum sp.]